MASRKEALARRANRVRRHIKSVANGRPRLSVHRSSKNIYAQVIDDVAGKTLASASTLDKDLRGSLKTGADVAELVLQGDHHEGADQRPDQRAQPADQRHQDHQARHAPVHVGQRLEAHHHHFQRARQCRQRGRQHEGQQLEAVRVVAERGGARLVLADRAQDLAEG